MSENLPAQPVVYLDKENKAPYVLMRTFFLISDKTPEEFIEEKGLPHEALEIMNRDNWMSLRDAFKQEHAGHYKVILAVVADGALKTEIEVQAFQMAIVQDQLNFLRKYREKHGDLCCRFPDGKIMTTISGQPMMLHVPSGLGETAARKNQSQLIIDYMKALSSVDNIQQRLTGRVVDMDTGEAKEDKNFMHLLETRKPDE